MTSSAVRVERMLGAGTGAYTVSEVCRVLQPGMTPRKVHYWLLTGLLSDPLVAGRRGVPTLLTFRQLLEIRTVQHLRDELGFELEEVRQSIEYLLRRLFADDWTAARFTRGIKRGVVVKFGRETVDISTDQGVLDSTLPELDEHVAVTRRAWESHRFVIPRYPQVVSNPRINAGAPSLVGTRIDTALIARFGEDGEFDARTIAELRTCFPRATESALIDALQFEGLRRAA
ncbi:MAG: MerR family transcriptional regulator [Ilumatobacteraceae bacterium]